MIAYGELMTMKVSDHRYDWSQRSRSNLLNIYPDMACIFGTKNINGL